MLCIFCSGIDFVSLQSLFAVSRVCNNNNNNNNSRDKRAIRVVPHRRGETRWSDTRPLAERQVIMLGRNCHLPLG